MSMRLCLGADGIRSQYETLLEYGIERELLVVFVRLRCRRYERVRGFELLVGVVKFIRYDQHDQRTRVFKASCSYTFRVFL